MAILLTVHEVAGAPAGGFLEVLASCITGGWEEGAPCVLGRRPFKDVRTAWGAPDPQWEDVGSDPLSVWRSSIAGRV